MKYDPHIVSDLFRFVYAKSGNAQREHSCYRTYQGLLVYISVLVTDESWCLQLEVIKNASERPLRETYVLYPDGTCHMSIDVHVEGLLADGNFQVSGVVHELTTKGLQEYFETLSRFFDDPETVRVDPDNPDHILTSEMTAADVPFDSERLGGESEFRLN